MKPVRRLARYDGILDVHRLSAGEWIVAAVRAGDTPVRIEPFAAIELDVSRWWLDAE